MKLISLALDSPPAWTGEHDDRDPVSLSFHILLWVFMFPHFRVVLVFTTSRLFVKLAKTVAKSGK